MAALGDIDAVRASLAGGTPDLVAINDAFTCACRFEHEAIASVLLDRSIALDPELGKHIDASMGRLAFIRYLITERSLAFVNARPAGPWQAFLMERVMRALQDGVLRGSVAGLQRVPWLLGDACVGFQIGLIERASLRDHPASRAFTRGDMSSAMVLMGTRDLGR